jgi:acetyl-CoA C-acetyltransferase
MDELIIAGGVNSASTSPRSKIRAGEEWVDWMSPTHPDRPDAPNRDMSITVGWNSALKAGVTREDMDAWALRSHQYAIRAIDEGRFKEEIVPIDTPHGLFETDEHPRRDTSMERLAKLKVLHPEIEGFSITAGNACGANDGAAALVVASDRLGLPALAYVRSWASVGIDPKYTGLAPVQAIPKALKRAGLTIDQVALFEINEAFAAQVVPSAKELNISYDKLNVKGGAIALGHPFGQTGARIMTTLLNALEDTGKTIGLESMCVGGGQGMAMIVERLS